MDTYTYLTTDQLAEKIGYNPRTIRSTLVDSVLLEGVHFIRPWGRRKLLFIWERIEKDMAKPTATTALMAGIQ
jgi:hypothetical protein